MTDYKTPGVYVEESSNLPPSVAQVETAVPAFIGFTEKDEINKPVRISSMQEFQANFGSHYPAEFRVDVEPDNNTKVRSIKGITRSSPDHFYLFYGMRHFFDNGGGDCYVVSLGAFSEKEGKTKTVFTDALELIKKIDEVTLLIFPDALFLSDANYYAVADAALKQSADLGDRFTIIDIHPGANGAAELKTGNNFRKAKLSDENLKYGAVYTPYLNTSYSYRYSDSGVTVNNVGVNAESSASHESTETLKDASLNSIKKNDPDLYDQIKAKLKRETVTLPPSAAIAGVYARVDRERGVWKAPANVSLAAVIGPTVNISNKEQEPLNLDPTYGKSINCVRDFPGKGTLVWGARTLAGNDNEWRYISVRRLFNTIEESVKKGTDFAVFEPNESGTWLKIKAMIEIYLHGLWQQGAFAGPTPESAYFVNIGLGKSMTNQDILKGRMIVEIGVAPVRPAEFIIFRFSHKMQGA
ncbi:MAG: phage tail sheath family protein [Pyrinomonadaceae bacterium]|nr:phage tail sheath family protein [Pyrinomonadaceae bacterium]